MFNFFGNDGENENVAAASVVGNGVNYEVLQSARRDLIGEIQAIIDYADHIHTSDDPVANATWRDIMHEEMVHFGELLALLDYLNPTQRRYVEDGIKEFNERLKR